MTRLEPGFAISRFPARNKIPVRTLPELLNRYHPTKLRQSVHKLQKRRNFHTTIESLMLSENPKSPGRQIVSPAFAFPTRYMGIPTGDIFALRPHP